MPGGQPRRPLSAGSSVAMAALFQQQHGEPGSGRVSHGAVAASPLDFLKDGATQSLLKSPIGLPDNVHTRFKVS